MDRRALEGELLTEPALQKAQVTRFKQPRRERHKGRRADVSLRPEQDARLLAPAHRMGMRGDDPAQECIQPARGDTGLPTSQRFLDCRTKAINMATSQCGNIDLGSPLELDQLALDFTSQVAASFLISQVPLVERDHQRTSCLLHRGKDAKVLFGDWLAGIYHHHAHLRALYGALRT